MPSSDVFDQAWQLAKHDTGDDIGDLFRKKEMTEKERLRLIHELNMINIGRNMRTDGSGGPMMPGGTREWGEAAGVLEPQPRPPAPSKKNDGIDNDGDGVVDGDPPVENDAENVEANIPMPEEVDETEVHVEEGEEYDPEPVHEELPDVNDLVQGMSKDEASEKLTEIFSRIGDPAEKERMIASIHRRIEVFSDNLPGLIKWAENNYSGLQASEPEPEREGVAERIARITSGDGQKFPIISPTTSRDEILRVFEMAEEGDEDARKHLYNSMGDLEDHFPDLATRYSDSFEKHFVLENPFANPFYDTSFNRITEAPQRGIANPIPVAPMEIIKEEAPKEIDGFAMNENDNLSLLPSSVFASNDAPVADNMSLLPAGWKADVE